MRKLSKKNARRLSETKNELRAQLETERASKLAIQEEVSRELAQTKQELLAQLKD